MSPTMAQILEAGRQHAGLSNRDLWIACCSLGGMSAPGTMDAYLLGDATPDPVEYDVIAQALNDSFIATGRNHPVPYAESLQP